MKTEHLTTLTGDADNLWVNGKFRFFKLEGASEGR